jgi:hypothetical protein
MIKINLLPSYILEGRRVRRLAVGMAIFLVVEALALAAYVWAPAPQSLRSQLAAATERYNTASVQAEQVRELQNKVSQVQAESADKDAWVTWVERADEMPQRWVDYYTLLNKYIPADVVLSGYPVPSGNTLTLTGATSSLEAAARWYLSMLRCEMVDVSAGPSAVTFQTPTPDSSGQRATGAIPKMQQPVTIQMVVKPDYLAALTPPSPPASAGVASTGAGGGRMGARGGGGPMGGGGPAGGRGPGAGGGRGPAAGGGRGGARGPGAGGGPGGGARGPGAGGGPGGGAGRAAGTGPGGAAGGAMGRGAGGGPTQ